MLASVNFIVMTNGVYLTREEKEKFLNQRARAVWLTGLPGSGKTTIAIGLEKKLAEAGKFTRVLDGDVVRDGLNRDLGFSEEDRFENIRRIAEVNRLFNQCGIITINAFVSPAISIRKMAKSLVGAELFIEIYVYASVAACAHRDPKGLYKRAYAGEIRNFTGVDAPYEPPVNPDLVVNTELTTEEEAIDMVFRFVEGVVRSV